MRTGDRATAQRIGQCERACGINIVRHSGCKRHAGRALSRSRGHGNVGDSGNDRGLAIRYRDIKCHRSRRIARAVGAAGDGDRICAHREGVRAGDRVATQ